MKSNTHMMGQYWSFEIVTDEEQHAPNVMVKDAREALKNTLKVDLDGRVGK